MFLHFFWIDEKFAFSTQDGPFFIIFGHQSSQEIHQLVVEVFNAFVVEVVELELIVQNGSLLWIQIEFEENQMENDPQFDLQILEHFLHLGLQTHYLLDQLLELRMSQHKQLVHEIQILWDSVFHSK